MIEPLRSDQIITERGSFISGIFHRWLRQLVLAVQLVGFPYRGVASVALSADEIDQWFDSTGLGRRSGPYQGWAICNGSNGTPDLDGVFPRFATSESGTTGGSNSHTHAIDHDHGSFTSASESAHTHDGAGLYANVGLTAAKIVLEHSSAAPDYTYTRSATATGYARTSPDSGTDNDGVVVAGTTAAGSAHSHAVDVPALSGTSGTGSSLPAFYELVPVMRVVA